MLTWLTKKFNRSPRAKADLKRLKQSACVVISSQQGGYSFGNGVFLREDVILTCLHNIENAHYIHVRDHKRTITDIDFNHTLNRYDSDLDVAILKLASPLKGRPVTLGGDTEEYLQDMKGFMVTQYNGSMMIGATKTHAIGIHKGVEERLRIPHDSIRRTFASAQAVRTGYSGSPIFDSRGHLSSLVCATIFDPHTIQGTTPHRLSDFVLNVMAMDPEKRDLAP